MLPIVIAVEKLESMRKEHTAVVTLCVSNGAVFSFAWYLPYLSTSRFPSKKLPHRAHNTIDLPTERHVVLRLGIYNGAKFRTSEGEGLFVYCRRSYCGGVTGSLQLFRAQDPRDDVVSVDPAHAPRGSLHLSHISSTLR
jgi:hypothetical protein